MKHIRIMIISIMSLVFLVSCSINKSFRENSDSDESISISSGIASEADSSNSPIIRQDKYYKIVEEDNSVYRYYIYSENKETVIEDTASGKCPNISMVNDYIIKVSVQTGTGIETAWSFYYNLKADSLSRTFYGVHDEYNELIVYADYTDSWKIVVRNMFDKQKYNFEFKDFKYQPLETAAPITDIKFTDGGKQIKIIYLTGRESMDVTETVNLMGV